MSWLLNAKTKTAWYVLKDQKLYRILHENYFQGGRCAFKRYLFSLAYLRVKIRGQLVGVSCFPPPGGSLRSDSGHFGLGSKHLEPLIISPPALAFLITTNHIAALWQQVSASSSDCLLWGGLFRSLVVGVNLEAGVHPRPRWIACKCAERTVGFVFPARKNSPESSEEHPGWLWETSLYHCHDIT